MRIKIDGGGHCVEIDASDKNALRTVTKVARDLWEETRQTEPRMGMGFGSQHVERTGDQPVAGSRWNGQTDPATG